MPLGNTSNTAAQRRKARLLRAMTLLAMGMTPVATWAQTSADTQSLDTVTVTGTIPTYGDTPPPAFAGGQIAAGGRVGLIGERDAMDVPFNVISYTSELMENQQSQTLGDTLQNDASVSVGLGFGIYGEAYKVRGFNLTGDDVAYGGLYGVLPRQIINSDLAERVEVFKGASAFTSGIPIGGNGGIGGTVNIEPKRAGNDPMLNLSSGYRSDGYGEVGVDASQRYGDQQQWGARVSATRGRGDTAIDDENQRDTSAVVGLDYRGEQGRILLDIGHQKLTLESGRSSVNTGAATQVPAAPDSSMNYTPSFGGTALETNFGMVRGEYDLTDSWTAFAALGGNRTLEGIVSATPRLTDDAGNARVNDFETSNHIDNIASQAGFRGYVLTGPVSHDITVGYSSAYRKFDTDWSFLAAGTTNIYNPVDLSRPEGTPFVGGSVTRTRSQGVTLSDTLGFIDDRLLLTLGARYQELDIDERPNADSSNRYADRRVTPAVGAVLKTTENVSLYANYVEALQDGGTVTDTTAMNFGQHLGIARAEQHEVGAKFDYGNLGGGISLFQIELPSAAVVDGVGNLDNEQRNRGLELSLYGEPTPGVRLFSSATWIDAKLTKTQDGNEGNDATGVPEYRFVFGGEWDTPFIERLTATGRVLHTGSQYADVANDLQLDSWTRLDLGLRYTTPLGGADWVWRAGIDNVTDENYWSGASTSFANYLVQGEPRTFKLSATVEF